MSSFKKISTVRQGDWLSRIDFVLDYSAQEIWPLIVRWERWIDNHPVMDLSGEPDQLGAVRKVSPIQDGKEMSTYCIQVVQIVPNQRVVWKLLPMSKTDAYGFDNYQGYNIFNLFNIGDRKTLVCHETLVESFTSKLNEEEAEAAIGTKAANEARAHWESICIPELKRLLAEGKSAR